MNEILPEFSRPIAITKIKSDGRNIKIKAEEAELQALALRFGVLTVDSLSAELVMSSFENERFFKLEGIAKAKIKQSCVVTLEPISEEIEEEINIIYDSQLNSKDSLNDIDFEYDAEDPPEPIDDGVIDVGEAVAEQIALAINPFPRKDGVVFEYESDSLETQEKNKPFAGLSELLKHKK